MLCICLLTIILDMKLFSYTILYEIGNERILWNIPRMPTNNASIDMGIGYDLRILLTLVFTVNGLTGQTDQALAWPIFWAITIHNTVISLNKLESHSKKPELACWSVSLLFPAIFLCVIRKDMPTNGIMWHNNWKISWRAKRTLLLCLITVKTTTMPQKVWALLLLCGGLRFSKSVFYNMDGVCKFLIPYI